MPIEGDDTVNDAPTTATRHGNYAQLMNKVSQVSLPTKGSGAGEVQRRQASPVQDPGTEARHGSAADGAGLNDRRSGSILSRGRLPQSRRS